MPIIETPFLTFWRALDAALAAIGEAPAHGSWARIMHIRYTRSQAATAAAFIQRTRAANHVPSHTRSAGKDFTP